MIHICCRWGRFKRKGQRALVQGCKHPPKLASSTFFRLKWLKTKRYWKPTCWMHKPDAMVKSSVSLGASCKNTLSWQFNCLSSSFPLWFLDNFQHTQGISTETTVETLSSQLKFSWCTTTNGMQVSGSMFGKTEKNVGEKRRRLSRRSRRLVPTPVAFGWTKRHESLMMNDIICTQLHTYR